MELRRKAKESNTIGSNLPPGVDIISADVTSDTWTFRVQGRGVSEKLTFLLTVIFKANYPFVPPEIHATADVPDTQFHCDGVADFLANRKAWSPATTIADLLRRFSEMLAQPRNEDQGWRFTRNHHWHTASLEPRLAAAPSVDPIAAYIDAVPGLAHIRAALTSDECAALIRLAEKCGFDDAHHDAYQSRAIDLAEESYRRNDRVVYQAAPEECAKLLQRVVCGLPKEINAKVEYHCQPDGEPVLSAPDDYFGLWHPHGVNDMWRFYRYDPRRKQEFPVHRDNCTVKRRGELASWLSILFYLSGGEFDGGETAFFDRDGETILHKIVPRQGDAVVFLHHGRRSPLHAGLPVIGGAGYKYVLRTDAMYQARVRVRDGPLLDVTPPYDKQAGANGTTLQ